MVILAMEVTQECSIVIMFYRSTLIERPCKFVSIKKQYITVELLAFLWSIII